MAEVAVVGAGTMGHALALVFALGGHRVRLTDSNSETLRRAPALMQAAVETLAELFRERDRKLLKLKQALRAIGPMEGI